MCLIFFITSFQYLMHSTLEEMETLASVLNTAHKWTGAAELPVAAGTHNHLSTYYTPPLVSWRPTYITTNSTKTQKVFFFCNMTILSVVCGNNTQQNWSGVDDGWTFYVMFQKKTDWNVKYNKKLNIIESSSSTIIHSENVVGSLHFFFCVVLLLFLIF